ncbi:unnamed protein product [Mytilus coruscus]|uniref:Apple domain-containing protein n=1 Tax=Mytilus coruscus TaxID=42192 RepID=A0A6J8AKI6_MYTCO|nr:unnamed protein product [Mytilus coruscus]
MWESRTRREAEEACLALNYSLVHVTPGVRVMMEDAFKSINDNGSSTLQFTIEFWANHSPDKNRPKGQIQYDMFPSTYYSSALCVKIVYEVRNTRFGWVPVDCENQTAKAGTCCNQGVLFEDKYKALLVLKKNNWYTADHFCKQEGGTLFDTNNPGMTVIKLLFAGPPWEEENVTEFWSALSPIELNETQDHEMCTLSRVIPPEPVLFQIAPQLVSKYDLCEKAKHMSICMIPTGRQLFYSHLKKVFLIDDKFVLNTTSGEKNITECMEECTGFNKVGVTCIGFNFNKITSTCRFSEDGPGVQYRFDPLLAIDLYYIVPITPQIYSEETTTDTFHYTSDLTSIINSETTDTTQQPYKSDISMIVITVAAWLASIASVVVLSSIVGRILSILNKNIFQKEQLQTCPPEYDIEIPSYDDDEVLDSTNIIHSLPPLSYEGTIY